MHGHPCCYDKLDYLGEPRPKCKCHPLLERLPVDYGKPDTIGATADSIPDANGIPFEYPDDEPKPEPLPVEQPSLW